LCSENTSARPRYSGGIQSIGVSVELVDVDMFASEAGVCEKVARKTWSPGYTLEVRLTNGQAGGACSVLSFAAVIVGDVTEF